MRDNVKWTEADVSKVAELLRKGLSASQIGQEMGRPRGSIIGKVQRTAELKKIGFSGKPPSMKGGRPKGTRDKRDDNVVAFPRRSHFEPPKVRRPPQFRVIVNEKLSIEDFIAKHGVRRFEPKDTCDYYQVQCWLRERGYALTHRTNMYRIVGRGRARSWRMWAHCVAFVDGLRIKEGLQPFLAPQRSRA